MKKYCVLLTILIVTMFSLPKVASMATSHGGKIGYPYICQYQTKFQLSDEEKPRTLTHTIDYDYEKDQLTFTVQYITKRANSKNRSIEERSVSIERTKLINNVLSFAQLSEQQKAGGGYGGIINYFSSVKAFTSEGQGKTAEEYAEDLNLLRCPNYLSAGESNYDAPIPFATSATCDICVFNTLTDEFIPSNYNDTIVIFWENEAAEVSSYSITKTFDAYKDVSLNRISLAIEEASRTIFSKDQVCPNGVISDDFKPTNGRDVGGELAQKTFELYEQNVGEMLFGTTKYKKMVESGWEFPYGFLDGGDYLDIVKDRFTEIYKECINEIEDPDERKAAEDDLNGVLNGLGNYAANNFDKGFEFDWDGPEGCEGFLGDPNNSDDPAYYLQIILNIIRYAAVALTIILSSFDFIKAVTSQDNDLLKKAISNSTKRLVLTIILFFVPVVLNFVLRLVGAYSTCGIK